MIESLCLLHELFLDREQVPVLPDGLEQVVEEFVEFLPKIVSDEYDVVPQSNLVLSKG